METDPKKNQRKSSRPQNQLERFSRVVVAEMQEEAEMNPTALVWPQPETKTAALDRLSVSKNEKQVRSYLENEHREEQR